ncbi:hypothetical protein YC2023_057524 [Brassica napus]
MNPGRYKYVENEFSNRNKRYYFPTKEVGTPTYFLSHLIEFNNKPFNSCEDDLFHRYTFSQKGGQTPIQYDLNKSNADLAPDHGFVESNLNRST